MRRSTNAILFSAVLFAGCALADEAADRGSIEQVVAALNRAPVPGSIFTVDASSELDRLPKVKPVVTPVMKPASRGVYDFAGAVGQGVAGDRESGDGGRESADRE